MLFLPFRADGSEQGSPLGRLFGFDTATLIRYGSGASFFTTTFGEWWRIVTPIFLHGGLLHFVFNSMALSQLGPLVEEEYGTERLAGIYVACGIAGSAASQLLRQTHTVGASGAICGLLGLLLVHGWRVGGRYGARLKSAMLQNVVLIVVISLLPGIDFVNHLGGFVVGCGLGLIVPSGPFRSRATELLWQAFAWLSLALVLASMWAMSSRGLDDALLFLRSTRGS